VIGTTSSRIPSRRASSSASVRLPGARVHRGHREGAHRPGPERVGRHRGHERGVDAARQCEDRLGEAVLPHVVARAEHDRAVDLLDLAGPRAAPVDRERAVLDLDHEQVLVEARGPADDLAVGRHHERASVEDQLVLTADRVHVDDPRAGLRHACPQHVLALVDLAAVVR
jgi:hypothetical protein